MKIPHSHRKKALIIVDVQPAFVKPAGQFALANIRNLIKQVSYDLYVEALFYSDESSQWAKQTDSELHPRDKDFHTMPEIASLLQGKNCLRVKKSGKSVFSGDQDLAKALRDNHIEEIHVIGYDTDDCVLATAYDAFDSQFYTYIIEECTASSSGDDLREKALAILRNLNLTNNSCVERIEMREIPS
jgi:nicotinamidase-related amidase